jgi:hypothetical protein
MTAPPYRAPTQEATVDLPAAGGPETTTTASADIIEVEGKPGLLTAC